MNDNDFDIDTYFENHTNKLCDKIDEFSDKVDKYLQEMTLYIENIVNMKID